MYNICLVSVFCHVNPFQVVVFKLSDEVQKRKRKDVFSKAEITMREWFKKAFSNRLLDGSHGYRHFTNSFEIKVGTLFISYTFVNNSQIENVIVIL